LKNLIQTEPYIRKVIPYLKSEFFGDNAEKLLFEEIHSYITKYNMPPTSEALSVIFNGKDKISETDFKSVSNLIKEVSKPAETKDLKWLIDETEKFCQERALHNAILDSIHIMDGQDKNKGKGMIPKILSDALAISFDPNVGHDYLEDANSRYEYYHHIEQRVPFDLTMFNKITKGGLPKKTLNVLLGGVNVGKTLALCHMASSYLAQNLNVLYITLEMAQERIAQRIDANLLNIGLDDIESITKEDYDRKIGKLKQNIKGKLIVKEYPTASAGAHHFKALLNECKLKKKFYPDIVIIDYINICCSSRIKPGSNINSYTYIKAIAEEFRGLAVETDLPILTATQLTRDGFSSSDPDMTDVAESFGLPATADWMVVMINSEELEKLNQLVVKQIKSRYADVTRNKRFVVGVDRDKQRLYDVDDKQQNIQDAHQTPDPDDFIKNTDIVEVMKTITDLSKKKFDGIV